MKQKLKESFKKKKSYATTRKGSALSEGKKAKTKGRIKSKSKNNNTQLSINCARSGNVTPVAVVLSLFIYVTRVQPRASELSIVTCFTDLLYKTI